jgi:hypothetical protein
MDNHEDRIERIITASLEQVSQADPALNGSDATDWVLVAEHAWSDGRVTVSTFRSGDTPPWRALGLLKFAEAVTADGVRQQTHRMHD